MAVYGIGDWRTIIGVMTIALKRIAKKGTYTIGKLYIDSKYFCDTLEDKDRGLTQSMSESEIAKKKVYGETAIPSGKYEVVVTYSAKFKQYMPLLLNVKGFAGIRIHSGNTDKDSYGCILVGKNTVVGKVLSSRDTYRKLFPIIREACKKEKVYITIE